MTKGITILIIIAVAIGLWMWAPWAGLNVQQGFDAVGDKLKANVSTTEVAKQSRQWAQNELNGLGTDMAEVMKMQERNDSLKEEIAQIQGQINENDLHIKSGVEFLKTQENELVVNDQLRLSRNEVSNQVDMRVKDNTLKRATMGKMSETQAKLGVSVDRAINAIMERKASLQRQLEENEALAATVIASEQMAKFDDSISQMLQLAGGKAKVNPYSQELKDRQRRFEAATKVAAHNVTDGLVPLASSQESKAGNSAVEYYNKYISEPPTSAPTPEAAPAAADAPASAPAPAAAN